MLVPVSVVLPTGYLQPGRATRHRCKHRRHCMGDANNHLVANACASGCSVLLCQPLCINKQARQSTIIVSIGIGPMPRQMKTDTGKPQETGQSRLAWSRKLLPMLMSTWDAAALEDVCGSTSVQRQHAAGTAVPGQNKHADMHPVVTHRYPDTCNGEHSVGSEGQRT